MKYLKSYAYKKNGLIYQWFKFQPILALTIKSLTIRRVLGIRVFKATFNNISVILWRSFLLVEETGVPGENHRPAAK